MCIVSMVGDDFTRRLPKDYPWVPSPSDKDWPEKYKKIIETIEESEVSKLRKEVKELKKLIKAAKIYDKETGQPDCEVEEKVALIRKLAELLGVQDVI